MLRLILILFSCFLLNALPQSIKAQTTITKEDSVIIQRTRLSLVLKSDTLTATQPNTSKDNLNTQKPTLQQMVSTFVIITLITLSVILLYNVHSK